MTITPADIQILESERMRDTPDGGGRMTQNAITSGQVGNIFPKVSRVDAVYGRVNLRKVYLAVRTATLDMFGGAHAIITDPPDNPLISCALFSTGSAFDTRAQARNRIESYVVAGPLSILRLYGDQVVGQGAILAYARPEDPLPEVGDALVLSVEANGYAPAQQFVRITDIEHHVSTFSDDRGEYQRRVVTLKISTRLQQTFPGAEPTRYSGDPSPTKLRTTTVADASRYYGIAPLAEPVAANALDLRVSSVFAPLVPSTQRETAISLAAPAGATQMTESGVERRVDVPGFLAEVGWPRTFYVGGPMMPGSVRFGERDGSRNPLLDNGQGELIPDNRLGGDIDYERGIITVRRVSTSGGWASTSYSIWYTPAAETSGPAHTKQIDVTLATRGTVYAETLSPPPAPGTLLVEFRALGRWYSLRDNGAGELVAANPNEGTGSVDYITGAVVVTLGAQPDLDSAVLFTWGSAVHYAVRAGDTADADTALGLEFTLDHSPVVPGSVTLTYDVGGTPRSVSDTGEDGQLSGTGVTGTINYATGAVALRFTAPPDRAALLLCDYTWRDGAELYSGASAALAGGSFTVPGTGPWRNGGTFTAELADTALDAQCYITAGGQVRIRGRRVEPQNATLDRLSWPDQAVGSFNAATGVVTLTSVSADQTTYNDASAPDAWIRKPVTLTIAAVSDIRVERDTASFDPQNVTAEEVDVAALGLTLDLTATTRDAIVPGSLIIRITGKDYIDRNGVLHADISMGTGLGTIAGVIDYATGRATLNWWADGVAAGITVRACLTTYGDFTATEAHFRTAGSPLRPASTFVQVTAADGEQLTGVADQSGVITGAHMRGNVSQDTGVVSVEFGQMVEGDWVPRKVMPGTLRYNCVVLTNLPLDAGILGLDPVRLPSDGRVPIFRPADVAVLHNTQRTSLTNPVEAGETYSAGRTDLAALHLEDASGAKIAADRYLVDLAAGTVTMAADWDGAGVAQPLVAVHRVEDMLLVSDVQINGQVSFASQVSRDYPTDGTYLSSALLFGDLQALVTSLFDQQTWTNVWSDERIGSDAAGQYNDIDHPVEVLNESAVTERWRITFTSPTAFLLYGENLGQIASGNTTTDLAPINPVTGDPYFVLRADGWGGGWATGNTLRFNTVGANGPLWVARTILAGATLEGDKFDLEGRGDVD